MKHTAAVVVLLSSLAVSVSAADLHKVIQGQWTVDEKARLLASPMYQMSTPERRKEIEKGALSVPATKLVFKDSTYNIADGDPVPYKILKHNPTSLVIETNDPQGIPVKDEITLEYVSDSVLRMTAKSAGITLTLNRTP